MATKTVLLTSGTTWTVPADLDTSVNITGMVIGGGGAGRAGATTFSGAGGGGCLLYTSDAADDAPRV